MTFLEVVREEAPLGFATRRVVQLDPCITARFPDDTPEERRAAAALERANRRALRAWLGAGREL